ncbi:helix-turn-helix transcriptional regulator [Paenibacillus massiliensis]|uniref:helix-turn-helix transcriptional regulator n=1 Tax=Paenibacillus massiliensis TaxID=225917 RepID=UPI0003F57015|nr:helix-turn-helix transcriptional regulator [Paenibacillus massiliensis]
MSSKHFSTQNTPLKAQLLRVKDEPFRWDNSIEVVIVLEGSVHIAIADEGRKLGVGAIEIFNINQVHRLFQTNDNNLVLQINIDAEFAKEYCPDISKIWFAHEFSPGIYLGLERIKEMNETICTLVSPIVNKRENRFLALMNITEQLLDLLTTNFNVKRIFDGNPTKLQRMEKLYEYLFNSRVYTNKASLNDIAKITEEYLNLDYLSSQFKLLIGDTLQNLLHYLRIEHAIKLLLTTDKSLVEVSIESGFSSPRYFYQKFNKIFPEGPKEFRKENKKKQEMLEYCREIIDPAFVLPRHNGLFCRHETIGSEQNKWINLDIFGPYGQNSTSPYLIKISELVKKNSHKYLKMILQVNNLSPYKVFGFEEISNPLNSDIKILTLIINILSENDIHPVFIVKASSEAISEQIVTIQQLIQKYSLTYGSEQLKGWRIEIR